MNGFKRFERTPAPPASSDGLESAARRPRAADGTCLNMGTEALIPETAPSARVSLGGLASAAGLILILSSLLGFLGPWGWFFDLFSHFRVQYLLASLLLIPVLASMSRWAWVALLAAVAVLNLVTIAPFYAGIPGAQASPPAYRALLINVEAENDRHGAVRDFITQEHPDLLVLLETTRAWLDALEPIQDRYPYRVRHPGEGHFGIALFSRFPLHDPEVIAIGRPDNPAIRAQIELGGRRLTVIAAHPLPPIGGEQSRTRNRQLAALPGLMTEGSAPVLLLGDLNVSPWSSHFRRLLGDSGLRDSSAGRGLYPTWPVHMPVFLIPIDHILHSRELTILGKRTGPAVGSDHYPVVVDFAFQTSSRGS